MSKGYWRFIVAAGLTFIGAGAFGLYLKPEPYVSRNTAIQEEKPNYHAGGYDCQPTQLSRLSKRKRLRREASCAEAQHQDQKDTNSFIEARRQADAADASAVYAYLQARISAWEAALGVITMAAAIAAAWFAREAAIHTKSGSRHAERSANVAENALRDALDGRRPWVSIDITPGKLLTYERESKSLMIELKISAENLGLSPAMDCAIFGKIKIIPKPPSNMIAYNDCEDTCNEVIVTTIQWSNSRMMTETIFVGKSAQFITTRFVHAHLSEVDIKDGQEVALIACVAMSYKTPSGHGGATWQGTILTANRNLFADFIGDAKKAPIPVIISGQPPAYY